MACCAAPERIAELANKGVSVQARVWTGELVRKALTGDPAGPRWPDLLASSLLKALSS